MAIVVPIAADFDSSGVRKAQASFAQFGQTLTKTLQQAGKDARQSFKTIEEGADNSATAAQRLAQSITAAANKLDTELKASRDAADALGKALGPELAAKLGRSGLNKLVTDLNRAGVSIEEITREADVLAAAIKQVDDVNLSNVAAETDKLGTAVKTTTGEVDRSRGVFANFTGNAAQEIPGVANALGPLNVAIGQFAEYATEGGISLRGLATSIAPIAAITVAIGLLKSRLADIAKTKAFNKADVDAYTKALKEGASASQAFKERIIEVGGVQSRVFDANAFKGLSGIGKSLQPLANAIPLVTKFLGLFGRDKTVDLTEDLLGLGLGVNEVTKLVSGGSSAIAKFAAAQRKAGTETEGLQQVLDALNLKAAQLAKTEAAAGTSALFFADGTRQTTAAVQALTSATGFATVTIEQKTAADLASAAAANAAAEADRNQATAIDSVREALYKRNNARYASEDADTSARDAIDAYNEAQAKANRTGKSSDIEKANDLRRDAEKALNGAAAAASAFATEQFRYTDETTRANAETAAAVAQLKALQKELDPGSALSQTVLTWILLLDKIPKEITTRFGISFGATPQTRNSSSSASSIMDTFANNNVFDNSGRPTSVTNITVNGAVDAVATANQINTITTRNNQRNGN